MRVLVVSEQSGTRVRAVTALDLIAGVEVVEAVTAGEAKRLVADESFDVLVIDGDLSPQGGFSLLYEIREAGELRGEATPPALVLIAREQDRFLSDWAGANELLIKPADPFELGDRVRGLAGREPAPHDVRASGEQVADIVSADRPVGADPS